MNKKNLFYFPVKKSLHKNNSHAAQPMYGNIQPAFDLRLQEVNISNGAELPDDKIRMKEQSPEQCTHGSGATR